MAGVITHPEDLRDGISRCLSSGERVIHVLAGEYLVQNARNIILHGERIELYGHGATVVRNLPGSQVGAFINVCDDLIFSGFNLDFRRSEWTKYARFIQCDFPEWLAKRLDWSGPLTSRHARFEFSANEIIDSHDVRRPPGVKGDNWVVTTKSEEHGTHLIIRDNRVDTWQTELTGGTGGWSVVEIDNNICQGGPTSGGCFSMLGNFEGEAVCRGLRITNNTIRNLHLYGCSAGSDGSSETRLLFDHVLVEGNTGILNEKCHDNAQLVLFKTVGFTGQATIRNNTLDCLAVDPKRPGFKPRKVVAKNSPQGGALIYSSGTTVWPEGAVWTPSNVIKHDEFESVRIY
jgi:hypothetical protein